MIKYVNAETTSEKSEVWNNNNLKAELDEQVFSCRF